MARRSDRNREGLTALIIAEDHRHMVKVGFAGFSLRQVAKRIGYLVWMRWLEERLAGDPADRIAALVEGYFIDPAEHNSGNWRVWQSPTNGRNRRRRD